MELQVYLDILKRRAPVIALVAAVALVIITVQSLLTTPIYEAKATIRVSSDPGISDYALGSTYADRLMRTYEYILSSRPMLQQALDRVGPTASSLSVSALRQQLTVELVPDTELLTIAVKNESPVLACDLSNMLATILIEYTRDVSAGSQRSTPQVIANQLIEIENNLENERQALDKLSVTSTSAADIEAVKNRIRNLETSQDLLSKYYEAARLGESLQANSITVIQPAFLPTSPVNAAGLMDIGITMALGLLGGIGLALFLENIDTRIHSSQQLEHATHLPSLGVVPRGMLSMNRESQSSAISKGPTLADAYYLVSLNLQKLKLNLQLKTILITSAEPNDDRAMVATNLAQTLAEHKRTVFLVDGDMRRPELDENLGLHNGHIGLSSLLTEPSSLDQAIQPTEQPTLFLIGGGPVPPNPALLLASPAMDRVLSSLGEQGHLTIIDAPPVLDTTDVSILAPKVDGVILVVYQNLSDQKQINLALEQLKSVRAKIIGSILVQKGTRSHYYV